jgi:hypothetical protein
VWTPWQVVEVLTSLVACWKVLTQLSEDITVHLQYLHNEISKRLYRSVELLSKLLLCICAGFVDETFELLLHKINSQYAYIKLPLGDHESCMKCRLDVPEIDRRHNLVSLGWVGRSYNEDVIRLPDFGG